MRTRLVVSLSVAILLSACDADVDRFYAAQRAATQGDHETSIELLKELGESGYSPAFNELGVAFVIGRGGERNLDQAAYWLERGAVSGRRQAQANYASLHLNGLGVPMDHDMAVHWFGRAAEQGLVRDELIELVVLGVTVENRLEDAVRWLRGQSNRGSSLAQLRLAELLSERADGDVDALQEAFSWLAVYATQNRIDFGSTLGDRDSVAMAEPWQRPTHYGGGPREADLERALEAARGEATRGDAEAAFFLFRVLATSAVDPSSSRGREAARWLEQAVAQRYPPALFARSQQEPPEMLALLTAAAEAGHLESMSALAALYRGRGDSESARRWDERHKSQVAEYLQSRRAAIVHGLTASQEAEAFQFARSWEPQGSVRVPYRDGAWPGPMSIGLGALTIVTSLVLLFLAARTWFARPAGQNVLLAMILIVDSFFMLLAFAPFGLPADGLVKAILDKTSLAIPLLPCFMAAFYVAFAGTFDAPITRVLSSRAVRSGIIAVGAVVAMALLVIAAPGAVSFAYRELAPGFVLVFDRWVLAFVLPLMVAAHCFVVAVLVQVYRSSVDLDAKVRARAYLTAYALRFGILAAALVKWIWDFVVLDVTPGPTEATITMLAYVVGEFLFAILFTYGIFRAQIFGIEHLFRRGAVKVGLGALVVITFFSVEQFLEEVVSTAYGTIGGLLVAAIMLVAHKPIMGVFDRWMDIVFPDVESIDDDVDEIYSYHFRAAIADGRLDDADRRVLRITAKRLGLTEEQVARLENRINEESLPSPVKT